MAVIWLWYGSYRWKFYRSVKLVWFKTVFLGLNDIGIFLRHVLGIAAVDLRGRHENLSSRYGPWEFIDPGYEVKQNGFETTSQQTPESFIMSKSARVAWIVSRERTWICARSPSYFHSPVNLLPDRRSPTCMGRMQICNRLQQLTLLTSLDWFLWILGGDDK